MSSYILDEQGNPVPCHNRLEWGEFMENGGRSVELTVIGRVNISTVFLGIDHNHFGIGPPILFETMIWIDVPERLDSLGQSNHGRQWLEGQQRYMTRPEALAGHAAIVEFVEERVAAGWLLEDWDVSDSQP